MDFLRNGETEDEREGATVKEVGLGISNMEREGLGISLGEGERESFVDLLSEFLIDFLAVNTLVSELDSKEM